jgi:hypothetical protein
VFAVDTRIHPVRRQFSGSVALARLTRFRSDPEKLIGFLEEHLSSIVQVQLYHANSERRDGFAHFERRCSRTDEAPRHGAFLQLRSLFDHHYGNGRRSELRRLPGDEGNADTGGLVAFYGYTLQLFIPLYGVVDIYAKVQRVAASARRLIEITDAKSILRDGERPLRVDEPAVVELKDVCFSYDSERSGAECAEFARGSR